MHLVGASILIGACFTSISCKQKPDQASEVETSADAESVEEVVTAVETDAKKVADAMKALDVELPKPKFSGTPVPIKGIPHLEKTTIGEREPIMVPQDVELISAGKEVTSSDDWPIIGELEFLDMGKEPRSATVTAVGEVKLGVVDRDKLRREYDSLSPDFRKIIRTLVQRLRRITIQAAALASSR